MHNMILLLKIILQETTESFNISHISFNQQTMSHSFQNPFKNSRSHRKNHKYLPRAGA